MVLSHFNTIKQNKTMELINDVFSSDEEFTVAKLVKKLKGHEGWENITVDDINYLMIYNDSSYDPDDSVDIKDFKEAWEEFKKFYIDYLSIYK